jgi:hypothetical protein
MVSGLVEHNIAIKPKGTRKEFIVEHAADLAALQNNPELASAFVRVLGLVWNNC